MKKFLIGCFAIVLILGVGGAIAGYHFLYKPAKSYLANVSQLKVLPQLEAEVRDQRTFTPPASGELAPGQVERFLQTQTAIHTQLGAQVQALATKYRALDRAHTANQATPSIAEMVSAIKDIAGLVVEAKRAQVAALNEHGFSLAEYEWTRARVYEAAGIPIDAAFAQALNEIAAGKVPNYRPGSANATTPTPEKNRTLVAPHHQQLVDRAAFVFFGL